MNAVALRLWMAYLFEGGREHALSGGGRRIGEHGGGGGEMGSNYTVASVG